MKFVAAILLLSTILVQANPVEKREAVFDPFALMVQKYISENDFKALCDTTKQLQTILTGSKKEEDQKIIQKSLEKLKEATHHLENFHCEVPVIATLVTTTEIAAVIPTTLENEEVTDPSLEEEMEPESMCDDCEVDYKVKNFVQPFFTILLNVS